MTRMEVLSDNVTKYRFAGTDMTATVTDNGDGTSTVFWENVN